MANQHERVGNPSLSHPIQYERPHPAVAQISIPQTAATTQNLYFSHKVAKIGGLIWPLCGQQLTKRIRKMLSDI